MRRNSNISTGRGSGNGGDIDIDADFIVALPPEDSNIITMPLRVEGVILTSTPRAL